MIYAGWVRWWPVWLALGLVACAGGASLPAPKSVSVTRVDFAAIEANLKRNTTNQLQVHSLLGAPDAVGVTVEASGARYEEWLYYLGPANVPARGKASTLEIKFNRQGVVRGYRWIEPKTP
jgi:hypothetical protein